MTKASLRQWNTRGRHCFIAVTHTAIMTLQEDLAKLLSRENKTRWQLDIRKPCLLSTCSMPLLRYLSMFCLTPVPLMPHSSHNKMVGRRSKIILILDLPSRTQLENKYSWTCSCFAVLLGRKSRSICSLLISV